MNARDRREQVCCEKCVCIVNDPGPCCFVSREVIGGITSTASAAGVSVELAFMKTARNTESEFANSMTARSHP